MGVLNNAWVVNVVGGLIVVVLGYFVVGWLSADDEVRSVSARPLPNVALEADVTYSLDTGANYRLADGYRLQYFWRDITHNGEPKTELYYTIQGTGLDTTGGFPKDGTLNYNSCSITNRDVRHPEIQLTLTRYPDTNSETVEASYLLGECS